MRAFLVFVSMMAALLGNGQATELTGTDSARSCAERCSLHNDCSNKRTPDKVLDLLSDIVTVAIQASKQFPVVARAEECCVTKRCSVQRVIKSISKNRTSEPFRHRYAAIYDSYSGIDKTGSPSCTVTIPSTSAVYTDSYLYGNISFADFNWICQGVPLSTYGNGLREFYLEENSIFYGNGGGGHTVFLKKNTQFVSGGGGSHTIYYEDGAKYDGGGNTVVKCNSLTFVYTNINENGPRCLNKEAPFIPTPPPTPTTTPLTTTTTASRVVTSYRK